MYNSYPYNSLGVSPEETFILNASISRVREVKAGNNYFLFVESPEQINLLIIVISSLTNNHTAQKGVVSTQHIFGRQ